MESFQAIQPSALLAPFVKQYWFITADDAERRQQRLIPTGCIGLAFNREGCIYSSLEKGFLPSAYLFGQTTNYTTLSFGHLDLIIVVFQPGGTKVFFKTPAIEWNGQTIAVDNLGDLQLKELVFRLRDTTDNHSCILLIERFLLNRMNKLNDVNLQRIINAMLSIHAGTTDISTLADMACLSYKQFKRIFATYIGVNPKDYLKIIRFQKTLQVLYISPKTNLSELAYRCGYCDLSHFVKEFKAFSGCLPSEFLSIKEPYIEPYILFRSCFLEIKSSNNTNKK